MTLGHGDEQVSRRERIAHGPYFGRLSSTARRARIRKEAVRSIGANQRSRQIAAFQEKVWTVDVSNMVNPTPSLARVT
jgi:hypothetical protein